MSSPSQSSVPVTETMNTDTVFTTQSKPRSASQRNALREQLESQSELRRKQAQKAAILEQKALLEETKSSSAVLSDNDNMQVSSSSSPRISDAQQPPVLVSFSDLPPSKTISNSNDSPPDTPNRADSTSPTASPSSSSSNAAVPANATESSTGAVSQTMNVSDDAVSSTVVASDEKHTSAAEVRPSEAPQQYRSRSASVERRMYWAKKHAKHQQHAHEHHRQETWFRHKKHVLMCSWAGRPVFARYGDDTALAAFMGVISAIYHTFQNVGDSLQCIIAGHHKFVFLKRGPFYLVAISRTSESTIQLQRQLDYVHGQILTVLTGGVHDILENTPNYDMRNLMGGAETLLRDLISDASSNPAYLFNATPCLRVPKHVRSKINAVLRKSKTPNLMHGILLAGSRLVALAETRAYPITTRDLLLVTNLVVNSQSLRSAESWTPVCLPKLNDEGFLYAYVCYLAEELCLVLITNEADSFFELQQCRNTIVEGFKQNNCMEDLVLAMRTPDVSVEDVALSVPEFRHFMFHSIQNAQFMMSAPTAPYLARASSKKLFRHYQKVQARMSELSTKPHLRYFEVNGSMTLYVMITSTFQLFMSFAPLVSKESVMTACNRTMRWLKKEEESLLCQIAYW
jgi:vacuolar fusion protein MON1